ncbi:MAG: alpha/beta fold hydrolase [bacterium]
MYDPIDVVLHKSAKPQLRHLIAEPGRAVSELFTLGVLWPLLDLKTQGDGHDVLVLPGFLGSDLSTSAVRGYLNRHGFAALPWLQGRNTGRPGILAGLHYRFLQVSDRSGAPISLVGHSLGGVFARELARQYPDRVRSVVTLGSPFGTTDGAAVVQVVKSAFERIAQQSVAQLRRELTQLDPRLPPGVPATAIFSRSDGVVHWQSCLEQDTAQSENIEVYGSHCGLVVNPSALVAMVDRLAQPPGDWQKFAHTGTMPGVRFPSHTQANMASDLEQRNVSA